MLRKSCLIIVVSILRPIWDGVDAEANLTQHVKILKAEGLLNIFFELDLAYA